MGRSFDWRVRESGDPAPISPSPLARARWLGPGSRTGICDGASMAVIPWLFDLVIIVGYFATALILGSWLMVAAPFVLAAVVVVVTIVRVRLDEP